jgi:hypothetical protein
MLFFMFSATLFREEWGLLSPRGRAMLTFLVSDKEDNSSKELHKSNVQDALTKFGKGMPIPRL